MVLVLGAIVLTLLDRPGDRWDAPAIMVLSAVARLLVVRFVPVASQLRWIVWVDLITSVTLAFFDPGVWPLAVLLVTASGIGWSRVIWTGVDGSVLAAVAVLAVLGLVRSVDIWLETIAIALAVLGVNRVIYPYLAGKEAEQEQTLANALAASAAIVHVGDLGTGRDVSVLGPVESVTSYTAEEWLDLDLKSIIHPDDLGDFWIDQIPRAGTAIDRRARIRTKDGRWVWIRDVATITVEPDGRYFIRGFTIDITEIELAHALIRRQAETDELTGLANRTRFSDEVGERLARRESFAIMMMDLDRFKSINDTLGHGFGDEVLIELADRLGTIVSGDDLVARLGGDEFAIVAASTPTEESAATLAASIAAETARPMSLDGISISTSTSIGVVLAPGDGDDAQTLMRHADIAMYEAKQQNTAHVMFDARIRQTPVEDVMLSASLRLAIQEHQLVLHFQPKVSLDSGEVVGFEGLARWDHPTLGVLAPERFIHLVTVSDQSQDFADLSVASAIEFAVRCRQAGKPVPVSVNLSTRSLFDETLPDRVAGHLDHHGLDPDQLVIEITEADIMDPIGRSSQVLSRLVGLGLRISIDDFGTGYSSFARLVDLPISEIKIDRRFVSRVLHREPNGTIVRSVVDLGERLNLHVIAEGVEGRQEVDLLLDAGCREAQGFYLARPAPATAALALLTAPTPTAQSLLLAGPRTGSSSERQRLPPRSLARPPGGREPTY